MSSIKKNTKILFNRDYEDPCLFDQNLKISELQQLQDHLRKDKRRNDHLKQLALHLNQLLGQLDSLNASHQEAKHVIQSQRQKISQLQKKLQSQEKAGRKLYKQVERQRNQQAVLEQRIQAMREQAVEAQKLHAQTLQNSDTQTHSLRAINLKMNDQFILIKNEKLTLQKQVIQLQGSNNNLQSQLKRSETDLSKNSKSNYQFKCRAQSLQSDLKKTIENTERLQRLVQKLQNDNMRLNLALTEQVTKKQALQQNNFKLRDFSERLELQLQACLQQIRLYEQEIACLQCERDKLNSQLIFQRSNTRHVQSYEKARRELQTLRSKEMQSIQMLFENICKAGRSC